MQYTVQTDETVSEGIKRIISGKVESAIGHIDSDMDIHETVHEVRKRCKEVRAAVRLVRPVLPTYKKENAHYRDAGRRVSDIRDAHAAIETFEKYLKPAAGEHATPKRNKIDSLRPKLVERRDRIAAEQSIDERLLEVRQDLLEGQRRINSLPIATEGYDAVSGGLRKSYKRARNRMSEAYNDPTFENFHEWRKRIKYHRYHSRLLRSVWVGPMKERREQLNSLSDTIGDENDLAEFSIMMREEGMFEPETRDTLNRIIRGRRAELHRKGRHLGKKLFAEDPDRLVDRIGAYWEATREYDPGG
jgi:CHAD domain-containing protein